MFLHFFDLMSILFTTRILIFLQKLLLTVFLIGGTPPNVLHGTTIYGCMVLTVNVTRSSACCSVAVFRKGDLHF